MRVVRAIAIFAVLAATLLVPSGRAAADIIHLTSGRQLIGRILDDDGENVRVQTRLGVVTVRWAEIDSIERVDDPADEFERRFQALPAGDAEAAYRLGEWARDRGLPAQAARAYWRAIEADPDYQAARTRLGHVRYEGEWMPEDEARRRAGYVRYGNEWITLEDLQKIEAGLVRLPDGRWVPRSEVEGEEPPPTPGTTPSRPRPTEDPEDPRPPRTGAPAVEPVPAADRSEIERQLAFQRALAREAERRLGLHFTDVEEGPLLVHTTQPIDSNPFREFLRTLGNLYETERTIYNIDPDDPIWPGKLQIFFFASKDEFDNFAIQIDNAADAIQSGGYFIEGVGARGEVTFHITMFNMSTGTLAHELSHAFMSRYNHSPAHVRPWLNEGTAEFMRYTVVEGLQGQEGFHRYVVNQLLVRQDPRLSLRGMLERQEIAGTEAWAYAVGWSLVDFMINAEQGRERGRRFVRFLQILKAPDAEPWHPQSVEDQLAAIEEAFEVTPDRFEAAWKDYIRTNYH